MYYTVTISGKGTYGKADDISFNIHPTFTEAKKFCKNNTNLNTKYWENTLIYEPGEKLDEELYHPENI